MRTKTERMDRLKRIAPLLACPHCGGALTLQNEELVSKLCGNRYPVCDGVPILLPPEMVDQGLGGALSADAHASIHPYSPASEELIREHADGWVLDLGAGGKSIEHPNVIQVDVFRFPMTDVVASADALPFRSNAFDAVVSQAVFEHLQYPDAAASEIWRVLKPDSVAKVDTAFLQPEHAYPHHYFNATEAGLRHWFRDFDIAWSGVEYYQHPAWALLWFLDVYLAALPGDEQQTLGSLSIQECLETLKRLSSGQQRVDDVPVIRALYGLAPAKVRALAAGVSVRAVKRGGAPLITRRLDAEKGTGTKLQLGLERRLEQLIKSEAARKDRDHALFEMGLLAADRTRYLLQYYEEKRRDVLINPGFWKPLRSLVMREVKRQVPDGLWRIYRAFSRTMASFKPTLQAALFNQKPADLVFIVHAQTPVSLLDMFFSLVHQKHGSWGLWICESAKTTTQVRRLSWELGALDARVKVIQSRAQVSGCKVKSWVYLPHNCILSFDAVFELVTLAGLSSSFQRITADVERWVDISPLESPMRCYGRQPEDLLSSYSPSVEAVMGIRELVEPMVVYAGGIDHVTATELNPKAAYAHVPKLLYRLVEFSVI